MPKPKLRFYQLCPSAHPTYIWAWPEPDPDDSSDFARRAKFSRTQRFVVATGRLFGDVAGFDVWSKRLVDLIVSLQPTGIAFAPAKVLYRGEQIGGYRQYRIWGLGGPFDPVRSNAVMGESGPLRYRGIFMDESKWDGSDVFTIPGVGGQFFSERIGAALAQEKWKNAIITLASESTLP